MEQAVAIIRMSTDDQKESPVIQRQEIERRFGQEYAIVRFYSDEGKSGSVDKHKRTSYLQFLKDCQTFEREWNTVLVYKLSRLTREDTITSAADKKIFRDWGIKIRTVHDGDVDLCTSQGRMIHGIQTELNHE